MLKLCLVQAPPHVSPQLCPMLPYPTYSMGRGHPQGPLLPPCPCCFPLPMPSTALHLASTHRGVLDALCCSARDPHGGAGTLCCHWACSWHPRGAQPRLGQHQWVPMPEPRMYPSTSVHLGTVPSNPGHRTLCAVPLLARASPVQNAYSCILVWYSVTARGCRAGWQGGDSHMAPAATTLLTSQCSSSACMTAGSYSPSEKCVGSMGIEGSCFQFWAS